MQGQPQKLFTKCSWSLRGKKAKLMLMQSHIPLKHYPDHLKPRERLQQVGAEKLSQIELLALLLGTGTSKQTALDLAHQLLLSLPEGNLRHLQHLSLHQLCKVPGLGPVKASRLVAALELGRRVAEASLPLRTPLSTPEALFQFLQPRFSYQQQEHFVIVFVDTKNRFMGQQVITKGLMNSTLIHPREVFQQALAFGAYAFFAAHNHPSGDPSPSPEDRQTTRQLVRCGKLMDIQLLDHLILGHHDFYSLRERESWLWNTHDILESHT